ncbi:hypothetical protein EC991_007334 [Linnemannia zychae]|nr:hypothetical protein EC991_007334 [Linnemannia zychae]
MPHHHLNPIDAYLTDAAITNRNRFSEGVHRRYSSRLSDHPAVLKSPPSSNGQIYVHRVKSRLPYLISQVSVETIHSITLISKAEYAGGNLALGYRLDGIALRTVVELQLHQLQRPAKFETESERIAFEIKYNTLNYFLCSVCITSFISGQPGVFHNTPIIHVRSTDDPSWWVERIAVTGRPMDSVDNYTLSILHSILKPRRIKSFGWCQPMFQLTEIGRSVWRHGNAAIESERDKRGVDHAEADKLSYDSELTLASNSAAGDSQTRDMTETFKQ